MRTRERAAQALRDAEVRTLIAQRDLALLYKAEGEGPLVRAARRDVARAIEDERAARRTFLRLKEH